MPNREHYPVVLIAEDDDNDVRLLRRAFERFAFGGALQRVADGEQAIAYLAGQGRFARRDEFPLPDFFLLDLKMPRMHGFEVLEWLQVRPDFAQLRTIVLTTSDDQREVDRAYRLGAASFLTKPVDFAEFKDTLEALMKYWLSINRRAPLPPPERSGPVTTLAAAIRSQYHVRTLHTETVAVSLLGPHNTQWRHDVEVFSLIAYREARQCFAWFGSDQKPVIILATGQITSAEKAVRSFYAQHSS